MSPLIISSLDRSTRLLDTLTDSGVRILSEHEPNDKMTVVELKKLLKFIFRGLKVKRDTGRFI